MGIVAAYAVPHPPLIVPEVGRGSEQGIADTIASYREVAARIAAHAPDTVVVSSPHAPLYRDLFYIDAPSRFEGDMGRFRAPEARVEVAGDDELAQTITDLVREHHVSAYFDATSAGDLDHATFIPLYFIKELLHDIKVVRVGLSGQSSESHRELGRCIARACTELDRRAVFVASGDMSHKLKADGPYGFVPEGPQFDRAVCDVFASGDLEGLFELDRSMCENAAECGLRSYFIMAGVLDGVAHTSELLSYEGPFGVGYGVAAFEVTPAADPYVALARASVEGYVRTGRQIEVPATVPDEMLARRAGAFVSLHEGGELRGCIGTIAPVQENLAEEIVANGVSAATRDPRFPAVQPSELDYLTYSVDVLDVPEPISSLAALDPRRYGVIVTRGFQRGLLLPNLEGVDTPEQQVSIALRKAGIASFDDSVQLERFEVVRHERGGEARVQR